MIAGVIIPGQLAVMRAALLMGVAGLMSWLVLDYYWLGAYALVLARLPLIPLLVVAALTLTLTRSIRIQRLVSPLVLVALLLSDVWLVVTGNGLVIDYWFMLPFLCYLLLPQEKAHWLNLGISVLLLMLGAFTLDLAVATHQFLGYLLVAATVAFIALLLHRKHALLGSLALRDLPSAAFNARQFDAVLLREVARSERARRPMSLIGLSLEEFGQLLQLHGDRAVAQFLPDFVNAVRDEVRAGDEVFRIRDELFVLLLPDCPEDGAIVLMERIKRQFEQRQWPVLADVALAVATVTLGNGESAGDIETRLLRRLAKQRRANLQAAAFADN